MYFGAFPGAPTADERIKTLVERWSLQETALRMFADPKNWDDTDRWIGHGIPAMLAKAALEDDG